MATPFPLALNSTRDMNAFISITPRPQGGVKVVVAGGVRQSRGIEPSPFVGDLDANPVAAQQANDVDVLLRVEAVAVMHGIDQGFLRRQVNGKDVSLPASAGPRVVPAFRQEPAEPPGDRW